MTRGTRPSPLEALARALNPPDLTRTDVQPVPPRSHVRVIAGPKPAELIAAEAEVRVRSGGRCEARTPWCEGAATQVHHRAGRVGMVRNDAGDWVSAHDPSVLLDVCGWGSATGCHGWAHQNVELAYEAGLLLKRLGAET